LIPYVYALSSFERPAPEEVEEAISALGFKGIKVRFIALAQA